jgi:hypothetical protein
VNSVPTIALIALCCGEAESLDYSRRGGTGVVDEAAAMLADEQSRGVCKAGRHLDRGDVRSLVDDALSRACQSELAAFPTWEPKTARCLAIDFSSDAMYEPSVRVLQGDRE